MERKKKVMKLMLIVTTAAEIEEEEEVIMTTRKKQQQQPIQKEKYLSHHLCCYGAAGCTLAGASGEIVEAGAAFASAAVAVVVVAGDIAGVGEAALPPLFLSHMHYTHCNYHQRILLHPLLRLDPHHQGQSFCSPPSIAGAGAETVVSPLLALWPRYYHYY